jgi:hypothetical protein
MVGASVPRSTFAWMFNMNPIEGDGFRNKHLQAEDAADKDQDYRIIQWSHHNPGDREQQYEAYP